MIEFEDDDLPSANSKAASEVLSARDTDNKKRRKAIGFDDDIEPHVVIKFFSSHMFLSLGLLAGLYVLARSFDAVLFIRVATKMHNYTWFLSQILFPLSFILVTWPIVVYRHYRRLLTEEVLQVPKHRFILLGALNGATTLLATEAAPFLSGPMNIILAQGVWIVALLVARFFLRTRYHSLHYCGASLAAVAMLATSFPALANDQDDFDTETRTKSWGTALFWILILFLSNIPSALFALYRDHTMQLMDYDVSFFLAWTSLFQLLFGLLTIPILLIPLPQSPPIHIASLPSYFASAFWCTFGYNTAGAEPPDMCLHLLPLILIRASLAFACTVIIIFMARRGFTALIIASAVHVAMAELLCTVSWIAGEASQAKLTIFDIGGLCMAVGGLLLYSVREEETDKEYRDRIFELEKYEKLKETADVFNLVSMDEPDDEAPMTYVRRRNTK